jgi:hypothetical protein
MTAAAFAAWVAHMKATRGWTAAECCKRLGSGNNQVRRWKIRSISRSPARRSAKSWGHGSKAQERRLCPPGRQILPARRLDPNPGLEQLSRSEHAPMTRNNPVGLVDQYGHSPAPGTYRGRDLLDLRFAMQSSVSGIRNQAIDVPPLCVALGLALCSHEKRSAPLASKKGVQFRWTP